MRLMTVKHTGQWQPVIAVGDNLHLPLALKSTFPRKMQALIADWVIWQPWIEQNLERMPTVALSSAQVLAPIAQPERHLFCIGKNYKDHVNEVQALGYGSIPEEPIVFAKCNTTINHPGATIDTSEDPTGTTDYEGELAVIIGEGGRNIAKQDAMDAVFGYTLINDVSSRELQRRHVQWFLGKSLDGYAPLGPAIVTADEIGDISALTLETRVNGQLRQHARVSDMIFGIADVIATISQYITLHPGDIIATGSPAGVGAGLKPPQYLGNNDEVAISAEPIGTLRNYFM